MNFSRWKDVTELVGIAAIVASLIFVGMEMRQAQEIAIADGYSELSSSTFERSDLISTHSTLIAKVNRGDQLSDAEQISLEQFVNAMWQSGFFANQRWEFLGRRTRGPINDLSYFLCENGGLVSIWKDQSNSILGVSAENRATATGDMARFVRDVDRATLDRCGE